MIESTTLIRTSVWVLHHLHRHSLNLCLHSGNARIWLHSCTMCLLHFLLLNSSDQPIQSYKARSVCMNHPASVLPSHEKSLTAPFWTGRQGSPPHLLRVTSGQRRHVPTLILSRRHVVLVDICTLGLSVIGSSYFRGTTTHVITHTISHICWISDHSRFTSC